MQSFKKIGKKYIGVFFKENFDQ